MAPPSSSKAPQKPKEKIPYEIKNAREWDPNYKKALYEDSTEESDYAEEDDYEWDYTKGPYVSGGSQADVDVTKAINTPHTQQYDRTPNGKAQSGSRPASHKRPNNNTHANGKRPVQPRKPKRVFNYKEDNLAKAQFRKGLPHSDTFILPKDCHEIEPTRTKMYDLLEEMGVRLGSFIRPPQDIHDRELRIWGNTAQVQQTITGIQAWLSPTRVELMSRKSTARERFANEYSNIGSKYKMIQKKMLKEAAIQKFQQVPEAGKRFEFTGTFLWPMDEVRPEDILGSSLEAFDPIRFQYQCHIVFDNKEACFKIMTSDLKSVETTNSRIEGTMKEYVARCNRRIIENLVEPPNVLAIREDIKVSKSGPSFGSATAPSGIPMLTGQALDSDKCATWVKRAAEMTVKNSSRIEQALRRSILDLPFYRGQVHMRVHFGTFALTVYRSQGEEPYPFEDFVKDMAKPGTRGDMIRE